MIGVGNGFKLAGLQKFLQQNLTQFEVERLSGYNALVGDNVLNAALFEENLLTFTVPYGLALQGLGLTKVYTSLLPPEIAMSRKIREKKPWAAATAAAMLLGVSLSAVGYGRVERSVDNPEWKQAEKQVKDFADKVQGFQTQYDAQKQAHEEVVKTGRVVIDQVNAREDWLQLYQAIQKCLPRDPSNVEEGNVETRNRIKLQTITAQKLTDLSAQWYLTLNANQISSMRVEDRKPPVGPGYLFTIQGMHYHHDKDDKLGKGGLYVNHTLMKNLQHWYAPTWSERDPGLINPTPASLSDNPGVRRLGITHAVLKKAPYQGEERLYSPDPRIQNELNGFTGTQGGPEGMLEDAGPMATGDPMTETKPKGQVIHRTDFTIQFIWQPVPEHERAVNDIMMRLLSQGELVPNVPVPDDVNPKLDLQFEVVKAQVDEENEKIKKFNARIKSANAPTQQVIDQLERQHQEIKTQYEALSAKHPNKDKVLLQKEQLEAQLKTEREKLQQYQELLTITPEQFEAFKKRFLVKGTKETTPDGIKAAAATQQAGQQEGGM